MKALYLSLFMVLVLFFVLACSSKSPTPTPTTIPTPSDSPPRTPTPSVLTICVQVANIRSGPGTNYPVVKTLNQGASIIPLQKSGEWYFLGQDDAKNDMYIHQSVVCGQNDSTATPELPSPVAPSTESSSPASSCPKGCATQPTGCAIKGNISSKTSAKTYYLPGDAGYDLIVIDPDYGERWFCTEAEAQANGWKHSAN